MEGSKETVVLRAYLINQTSHWFITGLLFPVLVLLVLDKGLNLFQAGAIMAVYSGTAVLLELPTGGLADSIGRKKVYMLALGVHIFALTTLLLSWSFATVAMAAFLMGLGRALSSGSIDAWFVDEFKAAAPQGNLQEALAKANIFIPMGLGIGCLVGGMLPATLGSFLHSQLGVTIFAANLVIILVADVLQILITNHIIVETTMVPKKGGWTEGFRSVPEVVSTSITYGVKNRVIFILLLVNVAIGFGITGLELLWQPRVGEIMGGETQTILLGGLAAAYFLITSAGSALSTPMCRWFKGDHISVMAILLVAMGGSVLLLAAQGEIVLFVVFYLTTYMILGMTNSPYGAMYNEQIPTEKRSTLLSFQSLVLQAGGLCGSITLGYLAESEGIPLAWTVAAAVLAFSSAGFLYLRYRGAEHTSPGDRPDRAGPSSGSE